MRLLFQKQAHFVTVYAVAFRSAKVATLSRSERRLPRLLRPPAPAGGTVQSVFPDLAQQLLAGNSQQVGRVAMVITRLLERTLDMLALDLVQRRPRPRRSGFVSNGRRSRGGDLLQLRYARCAFLAPQRCRNGTDAGAAGVSGSGVRLDRLFPREHDRLFHEVLQLANVARPVVPQHAAGAGAGQFACRHSQAAGTGDCACLLFLLAL